MTDPRPVCTEKTQDIIKTLRSNAQVEAALELAVKQLDTSMNDRITQAMYKSFVARGFAVLRFNFRGVGRSQGTFDNGIGELSDAASALDWVQSIHPEAQTTWVDKSCDEKPV